MAQQITPLAPSLPATTAIQDPAARRFAQAVQDALGALRSEAGAVESLNKAAAALAGTAGGTPASIAQWLLTSELYQKLKSEIVAVDVQAKQDLLDEAIARQNAIEEIQAALANIEATPEYDPLETYAVGDMVTYAGKLYRALLETTGNLPTNLTYWEKIGDYASLGEAVSAHALAITDLEYSMYNPAGEVQAEVAARQTLATQMRGTYAGTDIAQVTQGLMYSERVARSGADSAEVAARQSLATKVLGQIDPAGLTLATLTSGLIFEEAQVRSDADGSLAQTIDALEVTMGENIEAAILAEQTVRAGNDNALVSAINTAWAFTGATQAVSQSGQNLITNWTAAQANRWSQLEAEVFTAGGKTIRAALSEEAQVRANADGSLGAQWTIKTDINGYVAGFGFASTANNATPTSEFIIRADKFAVVMPGYGEHVPFAIGPSGAEFTGLTNWASVQGSGKPLDNSGRVIDGERTTNPAPQDFSPGETFYFKQATSVGVTGASTYGVLRTVRPYGSGADFSGGGVFQWFEAEQLVWARKSASATDWSAWQRVPNETITASNVTTYIANAALGNAQIGGNLWSTNWNYAGGSGWLLDRSGNFYGNNIYARGDIEASSLKANTLMVNRANIVDAAVDTLQIAGNAVTIPASAEASGGPSTVANTGWVNFQGAPVALVLSVSAVDVSNSGYEVAYLRLRRNGVTIKTVEVGNVYGAGASKCVVLIDYSVNTVYYELDAVKANNAYFGSSVRVYAGILATGIRR